MAHSACIVLPGVAYHVTHRGNQRRAVFFEVRDRLLDLVRAGLAARAEDWPWLSARAHAVGGGEAAAPLLAPARPFGAERPDPLTGRPLGWADWLALVVGHEGDAFDRLRQATQTGRPCGETSFVEAIEARLGRIVRARRRGQKRTKINCGVPEIPDRRGAENP